ncbi:hypothetical protein SCA6_007677 [Theobroma cacao]
MTSLKLIASKINVEVETRNECEVQAGDCAFDRALVWNLTSQDKERQAHVHCPTCPSPSWPSTEENATTSTLTDSVLFDLNAQPSTVNSEL